MISSQLGTLAHFGRRLRSGSGSVPVLGEPVGGPATFRSSV
ncbi:MAG: hypothetical protein ACR2JU_07950 [Nocardioidaceae bacterium]